MAQKIHESCVHCGGTIYSLRVLDDQNNIYCCEGCKTVAQMISADGMKFYYHLLDLERETAPQAELSEDYKSYLEHVRDPEFVSKFGKKESTTHQVFLKSEEVQCSACGWLLEKILQKQNGVLDFHINYIQGELRLKYDDHVVDLFEILKHLSAYGYPFYLVDQFKSNSNLNNQDLIRLGVAGAVFMNVMIFSSGIYLGYFTGIEESFKTLFTIINMVLTIPVLLYSAVPFYLRTWKGLRAGVLHVDLLITLGLWITWIFSVAFFLQGKETYFDSVAGLVFFLLAGRSLVQFLEKKMVWNSTWLHSLMPSRVRVVTQSSTSWKDLNDIRIGDIVMLTKGDYVPAKAMLQSDQLWVDRSLLTGESRPVLIKKGEFLRSGDRLMKEVALLQLEENIQSSDLYQLKDDLDALLHSNQKKSETVKENIVPWFTAVILILAVILFLLKFFQQGLTEAIEGTVALLIVSCPCALALAGPLSRGISLKKMKALGFLSADEYLSEKLNQIKCILLDKTGTLTWAFPRVNAWNWFTQDKDIQESVIQSLKNMTQNSPHPIARAVFAEIQDKHDTYLRPERLGIAEEWSHWGLTLKSSMGHCAFLKISDQIPPEIFEKLEKPFILKINPEVIQKFIESGLQNQVFWNGELVAAIGVRNEIKEGTKDWISLLKSEGKKLFLVSGDETSRTQKVIQELGLDGGAGGFSPEEKVAFMESCRQQWGKVLSIGDGFNDTLLLVKSDVGILVKSTHKNILDQPQVLYLGQNLNEIPGLFTIARQTKKAESISYAVSLLYNLFAIVSVFQGWVTPLLASVLMPLSSLSVCLTAWWIFRPGPSVIQVEKDMS